MDVSARDYQMTNDLIKITDSNFEAILNDIQQELVLEHINRKHPGIDMSDRLIMTNIRIICLECAGLDDPPYVWRGN